MTMSFQVDASELTEYGQGLVKAAGQTARIMLKNLRKAGEHAKYLCQVELQDIRYRGTLSDSFVVEENPAQLTVTIFPTAEHAIYVRKGTRPHWAPIGPLKRWAAVKLGDEKLAYPVQRSIAEHGTSMARYYQTGSKDNPWPQRVLARADWQQALQRTLEQIGLEIAAEVSE